MEIERRAFAVEALKLETRADGKRRLAGHAAVFNSLSEDLGGAARRAAAAMGYRSIITYTLPEEGGASLRAAGFRCKGPAGGGEWSRLSRHRHPAGHPTETKLKWVWP